MSDDIVDLSDDDKAPAALVEGLRRHGLDICTAAERRVLDACAAIPDDVLHAPIVHAEKLYPLCDEIQRFRRTP